MNEVAPPTLPSVSTVSKKETVAPCPFCDGKARAWHHTEKHPLAWAVECKCGARGPWGKSERMAVDRWNRRSVE